MRISTLRAVVQSSRPPFLLLTPACVALGAACAAHSGFSYGAADLILALIGGISAHVSVNTFNEYFDFSSGLDATTERTPFSGGSGSLLKTPGALNSVRNCAWATLVLAFGIGLYFLIQAGPAIVPIGLLGIVIIYAYTTYINQSPWACLIAPGLGFGPLMVIGTQAALTGRYSLLAVVASLIPLFLVSNLLLVNQLPDIQADQNVGRRHIAITYGWQFAVKVYLILASAAFVSVWVGIIFGSLPSMSFWVLPIIALSGLVYKKLSGATKITPEMMPEMGLNVLIAIAAPALLAITLLL
ncbi:prenyltransferase [Halioxenophilus aromaticivorans]|uniref:Prenyltransferase n=1 Tax=Halioxenophilus aromaticivorans TaxID=1306992 RepID=A0AAV3U3P3_9ALTE